MDFEDVHYLFKRLAINHRSMSSGELDQLAETFIKKFGWGPQEINAFANLISSALKRMRFMARANSYLKASSREAGTQHDAPPRSVRFVLLLIPKRNREYLVGDLDEEFNTVILPQYSRFVAKCWYFEQVMLAIGFYLWPAIKKILGLSVLYKLIGR